MGYGLLHKSIADAKWADAESCLESDSGKEMAGESFHRDLPLHMACENRAPDRLIRKLIEANPQGPKTKGRDECLPLHIAARKGLKVGIVKSLIKSFPEGLDEKDRDKKEPRECLKSTVADEVRIALCRPTPCWLKIFADEKRGKTSSRLEKYSQLETQLSNLHEAIEIAQDRQSMAEQDFEHVEYRLKHAQEMREGRLLALEARVTTLEQYIEKCDKGVNSRISTVLQGTEKRRRDFSGSNSLEKKQIYETLVEYNELVDTFDTLKTEVGCLKDMDLGGLVPESPTASPLRLGGRGDGYDYE